VETVEEARAFLSSIRAEMPDASHHVYAFRVGYGSSTTEGMSDDGEPAGTAGPPILAVLRGTQIGDVILVVTRYFGGTKLGTGGLVRAYSEAAHIAFNSLETELKIEKRLIGVEIDYRFLTPIKRMILDYESEIEDETFTERVTLLIRMPLKHVADFSTALLDLTAGAAEAIEMD
jgi:uncharacterized YigZ family protein